MSQDTRSISVIRIARYRFSQAKVSGQTGGESRSAGKPGWGLAVADVSKSLVARRTLPEKQFLRHREKFRFEVLSKILQTA